MYNPFCYYSFGLKIAGISSTKLGDANEGMLKNQNLYNDKELTDDGGLDLYDFGFRIYDPQIGRFIQIDPLTDDMPDFSPYLFAGNEPIGNIDFEGLNPIPGLSGTWANLGNIVVKAAPKAAHAANTGLTIAKVGSITLKAANVAYNSLVGVARTFNTYVNPLSPLVELATGKSVESDFTEEKSRVVSGAEGVMAFIPGGKIAGTAAKTVEKAIFKTASKRSTQGGLNLFKWGAPQTTKATGWKAGDYMLHLPNKGTPKLNWQANYRALRREMGLGKPIFDSYRLPDGNLIPTGGFLNAERSVLQGRGWIFNSGSGAWMPPGF